MAAKTLIYDATCATCRVMQSAAEKATTGYKFVDVSSEAGKKIIAEKNLDIEKSAYLIDQDRRIHHFDVNA
jgi:predicted DCC family thiol-disulfide oxidoreductase YuxK